MNLGGVVSQKRCCRSEVSGLSFRYCDSSVPGLAESIVVVSHPVGRVTCGDCGWPFCLPSGEWATCQPNDDFCDGTCDSDLTCEDSGYNDPGPDPECNYNGGTTWQFCDAPTNCEWQFRLPDGTWAPCGDSGLCS